MAVGEEVLLADAREVRDSRFLSARLFLSARNADDGTRAWIGNHITAATVVLVALLLIFGPQFSLFAMWFDMESNKDLGGRGRRRTDT
jgi:hypothetical protein